MVKSGQAIGDLGAKRTPGCRRSKAGHATDARAPMTQHLFGGEPGFLVATLRTAKLEPEKIGCLLDLELGRLAVGIERVESHVGLRLNGAPL